MNLTSKAFVLAPVCTLLYAVIRILDGLDGSYGPGLAWTAGHLAFLVALGLFVPMLRELGRRSRHRRTATGFVAAGLVGVAATVAQFVIDIVIGFRAADREGMGTLFDQVQAIPGVMPVVYTIVPLFLYVGLVALLALNAAAGRAAWWAPVLALAGVTMVAVSKDLLPLCSILFLVVLAPLARPAQETRTPAHV